MAKPRRKMRTWRQIGHDTGRYRMANLTRNVDAITGLARPCDHADLQRRFVIQDLDAAVRTCRERDHLKRSRAVFLVSPVPNAYPKKCRGGWPSDWANPLEL